MVLDKIVLDNTAKRYVKEWVFRGFSYAFKRNHSYVILGSNGSGKSTLLQVVSSFLSSSKGKVSYWDGATKIEEEQVYSHISIASPYMELPEEFTLSEVVDFHLKFKCFFKGITKDQFFEICYLEDARDKIVRNLSSGMKQRLKIALAVLSDTDALFLDEPTSNMDQRGIDWYKDLVMSYKDNRIVIVCSNKIESEYFFCEHRISVEDFKKKQSAS